MVITSFKKSVSELYSLTVVKEGPKEKNQSLAPKDLGNETFITSGPFIYSFFICYYVSCQENEAPREQEIPVPRTDQYSCLENPMDGGAWQTAVHGVAKSQTRLSDFTFTFHFHTLDKKMATHSSVLAWRIPRTGKPSGLPSMGSHRVGHD